MPPFDKVLFMLLIMAGLSLGGWAYAADAVQGETKRVLAIVFSDEALPFTAELVESLRTNLSSKSPYPVELSIEFSDRMKHPDDIYLQKYTDLLQYKYARTPMDAVLGLGDEAASVVDRYGETIFGTLPMILLTANPRYQKASLERPHLKNLIFGADFLTQIALIETLMPEARHLFIVSGTSQSDREGAKLARNSLSHYQGPLKIAYLSDLSKAALMAKVARLPEHTALLFITFARDATGTTFVSRHVLSEMAETANAPIFGFFEHTLGYGIVGGCLFSGRDIGKRVADTTVRILKGEAPSAIQPAPPENRVAFDWRQLKRWGIDAQRLPPHSDVLFRTPSFWGMYHGYIIPTLLIIFLQSVLVFFLFKESLRRRRTQGHLTERLAFEEMLFDISARFVDLPPDQVDAQIAAALRTVGRHLRMDRITYFEFSETDQRLALLYSYVDPMAAPPPSEIGFERFDWARNKLQQREPISFADIGCLPPEAAAEKAYLEAQGIKSALLTPVAIGERTSGVLALGMVTRHRQWSGDMVQQCGIVARLIADAMSRKRFDEALLQSKNYTRLILDTLTSHIAVLDRQGVILDVNASWERFARENAAASRAAVGPGANYLEICRNSAAIGDALAAAALEGIRAVLAGTRQQFALEYPCDAPAEKRWFLMKVIPFSGRNGRALVSHIDISGQKAAEIDLRKAYKDIEHLKNQLEAETSYLQEEIRLEHDHLGIVGQSAAIQYVLYKVEQVAATDATALVMGETGTGKELICRAIHSTSLRKGRPLVKVNCATLPANLIESELFGHERGAFSGALGRRVGRFEIADRGTLFLDEIGEMPLELQAKLLRVLEEGAFERLGSSMTTKVDVRVIAATNRDLETQIREGGFREDLYYRLSTFPITVPPLRERREDIPLLTRHFVDQAARRLGKTIRFISEKMMTELQEYPWPGNVRELKNVVDRAVIHCVKPKLNLAEKLHIPIPETNAEEWKSLGDCEIDYIVRVLEKTKWRINGPKGAAAILDLNPSTLRSRMRKLGIKKA